MSAGRTRRLTRSALTLLVGVAVGTGLVAVGADGADTACAQVTVPTIGPVDPACQRVPDTDSDGVWDYMDNCHGYYNPSQNDTDKDAGEPPYSPVPVNGYTDRDPTTGGDACDTDDDGDGLADPDDNCPKNANKEQADADEDGIGDACDPTSLTPAQQALARPAPKLTLLKMAKTEYVAEIQAGVTVPVRCSAACTLSATLKAGKKTLGKGVAGLTDKGQTFVFVRLSKKTLKTLAKRRSTKTTLAVTAADDIGRKSSASRRITIRR